MPAGGAQVAADELGHLVVAGSGEVGDCRALERELPEPIAVAWAVVTGRGSGLPGVDVHDERGGCGDACDPERAAARFVPVRGGEQRGGSEREGEDAGAGVLP
jgi:hypothetical protein